MILCIFFFALFCVCVSCMFSFLNIYSGLFVFACIVGFLKRETEGIELGRWGGGEDLVGTGVGETMIRIYYNKNSMCIYSTRK